MMLNPLCKYNTSCSSTLDARLALRHVHSDRHGAAYCSLGVCVTPHPVLQHSTVKTGDYQLAVQQFSVVVEPFFCPQELGLPQDFSVL